MAITIMNDASAAMTLGELNKNISQLGKQLKKVSSGQRINSAGDDASGYSISEKMRVRIRALDQNERNVQNGAALLRTAEGAIQQQIEIMKTIKEKVIDADNDTNTDLDRATIQKEIDQGYRQIEDIARETNYNGKYLLTGDTVSEVIRSWVVMKEAVLQPDSDDLNLIPNRLNNDHFVSDDGTYYSNFTEWDVNPSSLSALGLNATNAFEDGSVAFTPKTITYDLESADFSELMNNGIGVGFSVTQGAASSNSTNRKYFVLTTDSTAVYNVVTGNNSSTTAINIVVNSGMSNSDIAQSMVDKINESFGSSNPLLLKAERDDAKVVIKTQSAYTDVSFANNCDSTGYKSVENPAYELYTYDYAATGMTGLSWGNLANGNYAVVKTPENPDVIEDIARPDVLTRNVSGVTSGKGVRVYGPSGSGVKLAFVDGDSGYSNGTIGKSFNGTTTIAGLSVTMDGSGNITFSTPHREPQSYRVVDGLETTQTKRVTGTVSVKRMDSLNSEDVRAARSVQNAKDPTEVAASCVLDLTAYTTQNIEDDMDNFINSMKGKILTWKYRTNKQYSSSSYWGSKTYTFIDRGGDNISLTMDTAEEPQRSKYRSRSIDAQPVVDGATEFDLNELRGRLNGSNSVADVVSAWLKEKFGTDRIKTHEDDASIENGKVMFQSYLKGPAGNSDTLTISSGNLRSYSIDFATALAGKSIPEDLDGRGFRMYCATHHGQWFNFEFINGMESLDDKPLSGTDSLDIKTLLIDVSNVHNANELVEVIYDQTMSQLTGEDGYWDHYMRVAADNKTGKLIVYDKRAYSVKEKPNDYQIDGAKLADGIVDNVVKGKRNIYVKDLVIQDTDRASQNIHVRIPQTSMDHLFGYVPGEKKFEEFNVLSAESREKLLGNKAGIARNGRVVTEDERGYLDTALDYLTGANTLVGAQIMRLGMAENNIVTSRESTVFSESTIRDADMAKEMTDYTKANVLAQSAQSMLAQANQNSSAILSLLQ